MERKGEGGKGEGEIGAKRIAGKSRHSPLTARHAPLPAFIHIAGEFGSRYNAPAVFEPCTAPCQG